MVIPRKFASFMLGAAVGCGSRTNLEGITPAPSTAPTSRCIASSTRERWSCDACAPDEVCHPGWGCESACDVSSGLETGAPWPIRGGCPTRRGLSPYVGAKSPTIRWSLDLGFDSSPSAVTLGVDAVYVAGKSDGKLGILKLRRDGTKVWWIDDWRGEVPVVARGGTLYTMPFALQATAADGTFLWKIDGPHYSSGDPVVAADGMVFAPGTNPATSKPSFYAVTPGGRLAWSFPVDTKAALHTSPAISCDTTVYFVSAEEEFWAVAPDGSIRWRARHGGSFPIVGPDGTVYIGSIDAHLRSYASDGTLRWQFDTVAPQTQFTFGPLALGADGTLYAATLVPNADGIRCGVWAFGVDGSPLWRYEEAAVSVSEPVVDRDGIVFIGVGSHLRALGRDGTLLWSFTSADGLSCSSVAIAADGTTYARCGSTLFAFGSP